MGLSEAFGAINYELHISKLYAYGFCKNELPSFKLPG